MNRMRVVRLVPVLDFGGVESRLALLSRLIDRTRFDLRVCGFWKPGAAAREIEQTRIPVDVIGVPPRSPSALPRLVQYLRRTRPDVLHCSIAEANLLGLSAGLLAGVPVRIAEEVGMPNHRLRSRLAFGAAYQTASAIVGVTQAVADYLIEVDRAPRDRVRRIYNCAGPRYFPEARKPVRRTDTERRLFLVVGRLHEVKNHETLLRAFARVLERHPDAQMHVVGEGELRGHIEALRRELGLEGAVSMLGFRSDVDTLLEHAGAFVLGSHAEGCSISLIEAMATGLPALGSSVPGIHEVLGPRLGPSWTVRATDVDGWVALMSRYLELPPGDRELLAAEAQERAYAQFSPSRYVSELSEMYEALTQDRRG